MPALRPHYLDASAIVRLVVNEVGSEPVRRYFESHSVFTVTSTSLAEALGVLKTKRNRAELGEDSYFSAGEELLALIRDRNLVVDDAPLLPFIALGEVETLGRKYGIDIADALQLITLTRGMFSTLLGKIPEPMLITADRDLARAARAEGLSAWECIHEPAP